MTFSRRIVFPALVAAGVLWGTTVPLSKLALAWLAPGWLAFGRFALAAALLMIISRSRLRAAFSPAILLTGAAGYGGSVLLQNLGIERTSVTHAALLIGATPVLVAVLAAVLGHGVARPLSWLGFGISLAGVVVIASGRGAGSSLTGDGLVLASQFACAGFVVSQARLLRGRDPVAVTALQLMAAAVAVLPAALAGGPMTIAAGRPTAVFATVGLVLAGTVLPTTLFAFAQGRVSADVAGAFLNLEPLFGAAIGFVLFGNSLGPAQVAGGTAVVAGIGLSSYQVARAERARRPGRVDSLAVPDGATGHSVPASTTVATTAGSSAALARPEAAVLRHAPAATVASARPGSATAGALASIPAQAEAAPWREKPGRDRGTVRESPGRLAELAGAREGTGRMARRTSVAGRLRSPGRRPTLASGTGPLRPARSCAAQAQGAGRPRDASRPPEPGPTRAGDRVRCAAVGPAPLATARAA